MGTARELGYRHRRTNPFQRSMQALGSSKPGAWSFARLLPPVDRLLDRTTHGRWSAPAVLAGLPVLMVTRHSCWHAAPIVARKNSRCIRSSPTAWKPV